eukprot:5654498-Alexandrium_andersonii.AAC.1
MCADGNTHHRARIEQIAYKLGDGTQNLPGDAPLFSRRAAMTQTAVSTFEQQRPTESSCPCKQSDTADRAPASRLQAASA